MTQANRRSLLPLYHQVEQELLRQIMQGELQPGDQLPTESQISNEFGVSRITARRAIENLIQRGLVYSQQGKGTFVAQARIREISGFRSFTEDIRARGLRPGSRLISAEEEKPEEYIRAQLRLPPDETVIKIGRVRLADDTPVAFELAYLPAKICPQIDQADLQNRSLYNILREDYKVYPTWADAEIEATTVDPEIAAHLGLPVGSPVLRATRLTYSETFEVIEYALSVYRGDSFTFFTGRQYIG